MIKAVKVTNHNNETLTLTLANPSDGIAVIGIDGLGPVTTSINMLEYTTIDGAQYASSHTGFRNIVMTLQFLGEPSVEKERMLAYKYFQNGRPVTFQVETTEKTYQIEGYIEDAVPDIFNQEETMTVSIICPDPSWHLASNVILDLSGDVDLFEFPFENASTEPMIELTTPIEGTSFATYYQGDIDTGVVFTVEFLASVSGSFEVFNLTTNELLRVDLAKVISAVSAISAGDKLVIDTRKGKKSIIFDHLGAKTNVLLALDRSTVWPKLTTGNNAIGYNCASPSSVRFSIEYSNLYRGV